MPDASARAPRPLREKGGDSRVDTLLGFGTGRPEEILLGRGMPQRLPGSGVVEVNRDDAFGVSIGSRAPAVRVVPGPSVGIRVGAAAHHGVPTDPIADQAVGVPRRRLDNATEV